MNIEVRIENGCYAPKRAHDDDAGFDLLTPQSFTIAGNGWTTVDTGVHMNIPKGYVGMIKSKSGLNINHHIISTGVVDAGYTGSIVVKLYNLMDDDYYFDEGDKISQIVIMPIAQVDELTVVDYFGETDRGNNGFGSTGK